MDVKMNKILDSFNHAVAGIVHAFKTQRNMRIIFAIAILTVLAAVITYTTRFELIAIVISISLVFFAEMMNTAIEAVVNMITNKYHDLARIAKNVSAGASLIVCVNALIVGYLVFYRKMDSLNFFSLNYFVNLPAHVTFTSLFLVVMAVIIIKAITVKNHGTFLRGGMPSGHSALSFAVFTSIALFAKDTFITSMALILALTVAESRLEAKIHTFAEIAVGALLGMLITIVMYYLINAIFIF